jgi:hypothetical protein
MISMTSRRFVPALEAVLDLDEDLADLVLDRVRPGCPLPKAAEVGKQLGVDELPEVVPSEGVVVVDLSVVALRRRPPRPSVRLGEDEAMGLTVKRGFRGLVLLERVEVLQEQEPRGLLGVVQLAG